MADLLRERKFEFCAWLVFEVSKNWAEADADIAETIDFCEYYSREALRLAKANSPVQMPGERDSLLYIPLGVGAVIPPWNFPCAIMAGMTLASIVCGNTVILKPSSDSPTIAAKICRIARRSRHSGRRSEFLSRRRGEVLAMQSWPILRPATSLLPAHAKLASISTRALPNARSGPDLDQAHHPRNGGQGCNHRGRRC